MISHLLVPLDGSKLAEAALPAAAFLARTLHARLMLLHVIEQHAPLHVHHERHLSDVAEAEQYLRDVSSQWFAGLSVEHHVHTAPVADVAASIDQHARELKADLIVMCTHGRGGPVRWVFGSIAQQVVGMGNTPLLMLPPGHAECGLGGNSTFLVPLDGEPAHEAGLPLAEELAGACRSHLVLLTVVPEARQLGGGRGAAARMLPGTMTAILDFEEERTREYLASLLVDLHKRGIAASADVRRGEPARMILKAAEEVGAKLVVLSTHGKSGAKAFWSASVGPRVALAAEVPLLLVPTKAEPVSETP